MGREKRRGRRWRVARGSRRGGRCQGKAERLTAVGRRRRRAVVDRGEAIEDGRK
jgi:hypothetical protein